MYADAFETLYVIQNTGIHEESSCTTYSSLMVDKHSFNICSTPFFSEL